MTRRCLQTSPGNAVIVVEPAGKLQYVREGAVFILEQLSESVVKVTHQEQTGFFGINRIWDPSKPYATITSADNVTDEGIDDMANSSYTSPDAALKALFASMLRDQRREDARRTNPEERKRAARQVLAEFLDELPN